MPLNLIVDAVETLPAEVQALYVKKDDGKFHLDVSGVPDVTKLEGALATERASAEALRKALKSYDGLDPVKTRDILNMFDQNEEMKLIKDGHIDKVLELRTEKIKTQFVKETDALKGDLAKANQKASAWSGRVLENQVRAAAAKVGIFPSAIIDVFNRAVRDGFTLDDDGNAIKVVNGTLQVSQNGNYTLDEYMASLRDTAPHVFPAGSSGGGAAPSGSDVDVKGKTIKRSAFDALPAHEKSAKMREGYALTD